MATENPMQGRGFIKKYGNWNTATAVVFIALGILAIVEPEVAGRAMSFLVGWLLIFGGLTYLTESLGRRESKWALWRAAVGLLYFMGGIHVLGHPQLALRLLTLLLAGIILFEATIEFAMYCRTQRKGRSGWTLANCMITLLVGGLIWLHWPSSSAWAIGALLGINLLMTGISRLMLGVT